MLPSIHLLPLTLKIAARISLGLVLAGVLVIIFASMYLMELLWSDTIEPRLVTRMDRTVSSSARIANNLKRG